MENILPPLSPAVNKTGSHRKHQPRCNHRSSDDGIKYIRKPFRKGFLRYTVNGNMYGSHHKYENHLGKVNFHLPSTVYIFFCKDLIY